MGFKGAMKTFSKKLGFKSSGSKAVEAELEKLKKENAQLRMTLEDMSKQNGRLYPACPESDEAKMLEVPSGEIAILKEQLQDAQEKNQKWKVYDHERESRMQWNLARRIELEQQLNQAQRTLEQQHEETKSEGQSPASMQQEKQLQKSQREMEEERKRASRLQVELVELKAKYEEKSREVVRVQEELQVERRSWRQTLALRHEDQKRMAVLEQQIQLSARDFENEKQDRQSLQHLLHKVLKELRKARDQITRLESAEIHVHQSITFKKKKLQRETRFSEPSSCTRLDLDKTTNQDRILNPTSPLKSSNTLDERFLDCPICRASYPVSQHRKLLEHIDYCFN
ncbi:centrosomal protein of 55 kDa-like [Ictalurus furcatus]|uniref:centrosomal protein of 55 kDa-like n=1 Tax=Ictalurus furcatus TaxID=66913 RepID=UPI002350EBBB|nr:centrosomal protein of 55 kDa-like [Ictalurus furcatus]